MKQYQEAGGGAGAGAWIVRGDATAVDTVDTLKVYWRTCRSLFIYCYSLEVKENRSDWG